VPGLVDQLRHCTVLEDSSAVKRCLSASCTIRLFCSIINDTSGGAQVDKLRRMLLSSKELVFDAVTPTSEPPDGADVLLIDGLLKDVSTSLLDHCENGSVRAWLGVQLQHARRALLHAAQRGAQQLQQDTDPQEYATLVSLAGSVLKSTVHAWRERRQQLRSKLLQEHKQHARRAYDAWKSTVQQSQVSDAMIGRIAKATGVWGLSPQGMRRVFEGAGVHLPPALLACSGAAAIAARLPLSQLLTVRGQDIFNRFEDAESTRMLYQAVQSLAVAQRQSKEARQAAARDTARRSREQREFVATIQRVLHGLPGRWKPAVLHTLQEYAGLTMQRRQQQASPPPPGAVLYATCIMWVLMGMPHTQRMSDRWVKAVDAVAGLRCLGEVGDSRAAATHDPHNTASRRQFFKAVFNTMSVRAVAHEDTPSQALDMHVAMVQQHSANLQAIQAELQQRSGASQPAAIQQSASIDTLCLARMSAVQLQAAEEEEERNLQALGAGSDGTAILSSITLHSTRMLHQLFSVHAAELSEELPPVEWELCRGGQLQVGRADAQVAALKLPCTSHSPHLALHVNLHDTSSGRAATHTAFSLCGAQVAGGGSPFLLPSQEQVACTLRLLPKLNEHLCEEERFKAARDAIIERCSAHCTVLAALGQPWLTAASRVPGSHATLICKQLVLAAGWSLAAQGILDGGSALPPKSQQMLDAACASTDTAAVDMQSGLASAVADVRDATKQLSVAEKVTLAPRDSAQAFEHLLWDQQLRHHWQDDPAICANLLRIHASELHRAQSGLPFDVAELQRMRGVAQSRNGRDAAAEPHTLAPTIDSIGESSARISWASNLAVDALFHVQVRKEDSLGPSFSNVYLGPDTQVLLNRLQHGCAYMARVRQQQGKEPMAWGNWSTLRFHTLLAAPSGLTLSDFTLHAGRAAFSVGVQGGLPTPAASLHLQMSNRSPSPWCPEDSRFHIAFPFETVRVAVASKFEVAWVPAATQLAFRAQFVSIQGAVSAWSTILHVTVPLPPAALAASARGLRWKPAVPLPTHMPQQIQVSSGAQASSILASPEKDTSSAFTHKKQSTLHFEAPDVWFPRLLNIASGAGRFFYVNLRTNQSSFDPSQSAQRSSAQVRGSDVRVRHAEAKAVRIQPQHREWLVVWDPARGTQDEQQQAYYFYNTQTQERCWERPSVPLDAAADSGVTHSTTGDWAFGLHTEFVQGGTETHEEPIAIQSHPSEAPPASTKRFVLAHEDLQLKATTFRSTLTQECTAALPACSAELQCFDKQGQVVHTATTSDLHFPASHLAKCSCVQLQYTVQVGKVQYVSLPATAAVPSKHAKHSM